MRRGGRLELACRFVRTAVSAFPGPPGPGVGAHGVNEEPRCLVIDAHPTIRLGVRGLLSDRYEVDEVEDGRGALELITSIGDFDVAIVELAPTENGENRGLIGIPAIRALHKARPGLGIVAHGRRPDRQAATRALAAGATAYVAKSSPGSAAGQARSRGASARSCSTTRTGYRPPRSRNASDSAPRPSARIPRPPCRGSAPATVRTRSRSGSATPSSNNDDSPAPLDAGAEKLPVVIQSQPRSRAISTA